MNPLLSVAPHRHLVIAHRGNSAHAPENTIEAFQQAVALGVDGMEFDVHVTKDGHAVVIHDERVDRTTNGSGLVAQMTLAQIRGLDAGARFVAPPVGGTPYAGRGIGVPTLQDVLDTFPSVPCMVEIKTPDASAEVRRIVLDQRGQGRCVICSFVERALDVFEGSGIPLGASPVQLRRLYWQGYLRRAVPRVPFQMVSTSTSHRHLPLPIGGWAAILEPLGVPVHVWTIDDVREARRLWAKGVRGILTNDPATILRAADS